MKNLENNQLPKIFWERLSVFLSKQELEQINNAFNIKHRNPVFRVNTLKGDKDIILGKIKDAGIEIEEIKFLKNAYKVLNKDEKFIKNLSIYKNGEIYFQTISSQLPVDLFSFNDSDKILDVCSAPGSKTTQMAQALNNSGSIIANDLNLIRIQKLEYNLRLLGVTNTKTIKGDALELINKFDKEEFDKILLDVPCSSEGRIKYDTEKSYKNWTEKSPKRFYQIQKNIVKSVIPLLKEGGELIYSTCSISPEENENIVHMILCNFPNIEIQDIEVDYSFIKNGLSEFGKNIYKKEVSKSIRILPNEETQGFFIAKFKKTQTI